MERKKVSKYLVPKCFFLNEYWNVPDKIDFESARSELKQLNKYQVIQLFQINLILVIENIFID